MPFSQLMRGLADGDGSVPRQHQLYRLLKQAILAGSLAPGQRLPASRQLAADYRLARNSVLYAYQQLLAEGFLDADRRGTRVAALPLLRGVAARGRGGKRPPAGDGAAGVAAASTVLSARARGLLQKREEGLLPFAPGPPDLNAFPWPAWVRCLQQAWGEVSARHLALAQPGGEPALRQAVAEFLAARRGVACTAAQVFIVPGSQMALDACARLLADEGDTVWLERPGYPSARSAMQGAGLRLVDVPVDAQGMAPSAALWQSAPPRLLYLTPSHQYPLGAVLSLERRLEFLQRLRPGQGWIIEDDYDSEFNHAHAGARPLPAIQGLQAEAPVIYIGTFSKLLYPGLRLAYMVLPSWAAAAMGEAIASLYRSGQGVEQRALARFIESGRLTRHQRRMAPIYRARQQRLRAALLAHFGDVGEVLGGSAGLHLCLSLPGCADDQQLVQACAAQGISARALSSYYAAPSRHDPRPPAQGLVLGYGMVELERIDELVGRMRQAYDAC